MHFCTCPNGPRKIGRNIKLWFSCIKGMFLINDPYIFFFPDILLTILKYAGQLNWIIEHNAFAMPQISISGWLCGTLDEDCTGTITTVIYH